MQFEWNVQKYPIDFIGFYKTFIRNMFGQYEGDGLPAIITDFDFFLKGNPVIENE